MRSIGQSAAGLWEIRKGWQEHSFINLMSWAGIERLERIEKSGHRGAISLDLTNARIHAANALLRGLYGGALRNGPTDSSDDAALTQLQSWATPTDRSVSPRCCTSPASCRFGVETRTPGGYHYMHHDDFGKLEGAFVICSIWIAQALARLGPIPEARTILRQVLDSADHVGLLSEHVIPSTNTQCGDFLQAYSLVGLINAAFAVSPPWSDVL